MEQRADFSQYFIAAVDILTRSGKLPYCTWLSWEFLPPKVPSRGDLCTFTVLRTVHKLKKHSNIDCSAETWCSLILSALPEIPSVLRTYSENGIINLILSNTQVVSSPKNSFLQFEPIGYLSSCFSEKFATPRQSIQYLGFYSKYSRGEIVLSSVINSDSLEGLEAFSHIWLIFVFHESIHSKFKSKIKPPRLNGEKKGIFATRAPHRYNPIGLSVVKIERISGRSLLVSGVDLIDNTPILDIKPYHPADCIDPHTVPAYIHNPIYIYKVEFHPHALQRIEFIKASFQLRFYSPTEDWQEMIQEILAQDPSTVHTKLKHQDLGLYGFKIDLLYVVYIRNSADNSNLVVNVLHQNECAIHDLRTDTWLQEMRTTLTNVGIII